MRNKKLPDNNFLYHSTIYKNIIKNSIKKRHSYDLIVIIAVINYLLEVLLKSFILLFSFILLLSSVASAAVTGSVIKKPPKGWHWYDDPKLKEPEKKTKVVKKTKITTKKKEMIKLDTKWLRDNLPILLDKAQDEPTQDNIAAYYYAQRIAIDKASGFSKGSKEFFMFEEILKESNRRPTEKISIFQNKDTTQSNQTLILNKIFSQAGLWVFYASDCPYCHKQFPVLEGLVRIHDISVLAISINGITLDRQFPLLKHVIDYDQTITKNFNVALTPTTFLVGNDGKIFHPISEGIVAGKELIARILVAARRLKLIDEQEFSDAKEVKDISTISTIITADKDKLESDPKYLAELLRKQLKKSKSSTANEVRINENN